MKILSLTFSNLNSLKGTWHIDFTDDAFVSDGLFAITGQTGAGKTTILDAICLAIYGQTPRISNISTTQNELMSVDRGGCHSEVVVLMNENHGDKIYRFSFEQWRAGKKADGKLQPIKREISVLDSTSGEGVILETKPSLCDKKAVELMHMNFEQFTRSVMLAQGNFSAFLRADANEKGAILERITGTHIYAKISQKAFEVHKQKKEELHQLEQKVGDITLMDDESFMALKTSIDDTQSLIHDHDRELNTLEAVIHFYQEKHQANQEINKYKEDLIAAEEAIGAFAEQSALLLHANKAHEILPTYHELTQKKDALHQITATATALQQSLPLLHQSIHELQSQITTKEQALSHHKATHENNLPIFKQIRELDNLIHHHQINLEKISNDIHHNKDLIHASKETLASLHLEQDTVNQHLMSMNEKYEKMTPYPNIKQDLGILSGHYRELSTYLSQHRQNQQHFSEQNHEILQQEKSIEDKRIELRQKMDDVKAIETPNQSLADDINQILKHSLMIEMPNLENIAAYNVIFKERIHEVQKALSVIHQLKKTHEDHQKINEQIHQLTIDIHDTNTQKTALKKEIDELTQTTHQEQLTLSILQKNHELQQELLALKEYHAKLVEDEPCPLCGSLNHPYAQNHPFIHTADDDIKTAIHHAMQQIKSHENALQAHKETLANIQATKRHQETLCQSLMSQKNELANRLCDEYQHIIHEPCMSSIAKSSTLSPSHQADISSMSNDLSQLDMMSEQYLSQLTHAYDDFEALAVKFTQNNQQLHRLNQEIEKITQEGKHLKSTIETMKNHHHKLQSSMNEHEQSMFELITLINEKLIAYQKSPIQDLDYALTLVQHHIYDLTKLNDEYDTYHAQKQELTSKLSHLNIHLVNEQKQLDHHLAEVHQLNDKKQNLETQYHTHQKQREQLFGDKNVDDEDMALRGLIEESQRQLDDIQKIHHNKHQEYISLTEKINHHQEHISTLTKESDELTWRFDQLLIKQGFAHIDEFLAACMEDHERASLNEQEQSLSYALKQATDNLAYWHAKEEALREKQKNNPSPLYQLSLDELITKKDDLKRNQHELLTTIGKQRQQFITAEEERNKHSSLMSTIDDKKQDLKIWAKLDDLIGSKEGIKYRNFVQGLTLGLMLHHANQVLSQMDGRYVLIHDNKNNKSSLEISIIDTAQGSEIRSTKNLSGGESFIISLSLAMGLSKMSSENVNINSLFLDEGFGTLDDEILDIALSVLSSLKDTGKMIGIISHVQSLKERIPTQIQVKKIANGESRLLGSGVHRQ